MWYDAAVSMSVGVPVPPPPSREFFRDNDNIGDSYSLQYFWNDHEREYSYTIRCLVCILMFS